jgi:hypothetical protein
MSTLSVANIHFESTANNRVQYVGSNTITISTAGTERVRIDDVGNTTFSTTMSITGNVSIGTSSPWQKLSVYGTGTVGDLTTARQLSIGTGNTYGLHIGYIQSAVSNPFVGVLQSVDNGNGTYLSLNPGGGNVGIGTTSPSEKLNVSGNILASGNITAYSDIKLKKNIITIDNALDKVSMMRGVMYTRKDTGVRGTGVIAQEIQEILPEVVHNGEYLSVSYGNIVGVLIEAIKELKAEIEQLKGK